jgi:hypothetical protein
MVNEQVTAAVTEIDREEERPAGNPASTIVNHARSLPRIPFHSIRATFLRSTHWHTS